MILVLGLVPLFNSCYNFGIYWVCICLYLSLFQSKKKQPQNPTRKKKTLMVAFFTSDMLRDFGFVFHF